MAIEKGLFLIYDDTTPIKIRGDCIELRRVITNLVGNAIKFTDVGHIKIAVRQDADCVSISVEDIATAKAVKPLCEAQLP